MRRVVVIGAGAAGTMAAIFAARGGAAVTLVERTSDGGKKIVISGGGRCNVLPVELAESRFVTDSSPNSLKKILRSWPLAKQREFFEHDLGIPLVEEPGVSPGSGKLFPRSNKARDIRDALLESARGAGVKCAFGREVRGVEPVAISVGGFAGAGGSARGGGHVGDGGSASAVGPAGAGGWRVLTVDGSLEADAVILATGGLSVPATGSDGFGIRIARNLGHDVHELYAALTPVHASAVSGSPYSTLAGISVSAVVTAEDRVSGRRATSTGGFLFTHQGYSGPSILDVSHVLVRAARPEDAQLHVKWTSYGEEEWTRILTMPSGTAPAAGRRENARPSAGVVTLLREVLPARLAEALMAAADVPRDRTLATLRREERLRLVSTLTRGVLPWNGHAGYQKAEVTGGGVSLKDVDPRTLESRRSPGLFLAGELLDAFGPIGGFNFAWAWATGRAAGIGASAARDAASVPESDAD